MMDERIIKATDEHGNVSWSVNTPREYPVLYLTDKKSARSAQELVDELVRLRDKLEGSSDA